MSSREIRKRVLQRRLLLQILPLKRHSDEDIDAMAASDPATQESKHYISLQTCGPLCREDHLQSSGQDLIMVVREPPGDG